MSLVTRKSITVAMYYLLVAGEPKREREREQVINTLIPFKGWTPRT